MSHYALQERATQYFDYLSNADYTREEGIRELYALLVEIRDAERERAMRIARGGWRRWKPGDRGTVTEAIAQTIREELWEEVGDA